MKTLKRRLIFTAAALLCLTFTGCSATSSQGDMPRDGEHIENILPDGAARSDEQTPPDDNGDNGGEGDRCPDCPDGKCPHGGHRHRPHGRDGGWRRVKPRPIAPPDDGEAARTAKTP